MRRLFIAAVLLAPFAASAASPCKYEAPRNLQLDLAGVRAVQIELHSQDLHLTGSASARDLKLTGRLCFGSGDAGSAADHPASRG